MCTTRYFTHELLLFAIMLMNPLEILLSQCLNYCFKRNKIFCSVDETNIYDSNKSLCLQDTGNEQKINVIQHLRRGRPSPTVLEISRTERINTIPTGRLRTSETVKLEWTIIYNILYSVTWSRYISIFDRALSFDQIKSQQTTSLTYLYPSGKFLSFLIILFYLIFLFATILPTMLST